jgi:hypothetical protein
MDLWLRVMNNEVFCFEKAFVVLSLFFSRAAVVVFAAKQVLKKGRRSRSRRMEGSGERQKK